MNEADTRAEHIDPALKAAGWGVVDGSRVRREVPITPGRNIQTGVDAETATYPTPDELWARTFAQEDPWRDRFAAVPYEDKGGSHPGRY